MKYMLLIHTDPNAFAGPDGAALIDDVLARHQQLGAELVAAGVEFSGGRLRPASDATTIRWRDGAASVQDGPFAESHEELGGYYIVDVPDLDAALEWARKIPVVGTGAVEVRPLWVGPGA